MALLKTNRLAGKFALQSFSILLNRAIVQGVSRWPITEETRARSQDILYGNCDKRSGSESGISLSNLDFLCWDHSTHILFLCNRYYNQMGSSIKQFCHSLD